MCAGQSTNPMCPFKAKTPMHNADDLLKFCAAIGLHVTPRQITLLVAWCNDDPEGEQHETG